jgi:HD-GYP domain-containing protein (c-di-GMP phosphodiesterase class II)
MELAAMLSQVAYVTLPSDTLERLRSAPALSAAEQAMLGRLPEVSERLIASIPRLEDVRAILRHQNARLDGGVEIPAGARILKCVLDLDALEVGGMAPQMAIPVLRGRTGWYDPAVLEALERRENAQDDAFESRELNVVELRPGMILIDDDTTIEDRLLVAHGQEVGVSLIERLRNFAENTGVKEPIRVLVPTRKSS